ncbi:hypothetical protein BASA81_007352 [Batrachochytrium salamandrivorans]|nr:hypothetical protein BASA81_007352 [Batrachochytrium salamandrivorans]
MKQDMHKPVAQTYMFSLGVAWFLIAYLPTSGATEESKINSTFLRRYDAKYRKLYEDQENQKIADQVAAIKAARA